MLEFNKLLAERKPLSTILSDDRWEKNFRQALRFRSEDLIEYLKNKEILSDIVDGLINEEGRTFQDASESLNILLADIEPVVDTVIADHLPTLFIYLDKDKHQPRRVYFFLRVMSFLFQNRSIEMFSFVNHHPDVIKKLVHHIRSPHILQLLLNMLSVERQIKGCDIPDSTWSENCGLISKVVEALERNPEENLDAVHKFYSEVCLSYPSDSDFVKNILLVQEAALIKSVVGLMDNKNTASDAVKLLDQVVLTIMMDNKHHIEFFNAARDHLHSRRYVFQNLLNSDSLIMALAGTKLVQSLVKHNLANLLDKGILSCLELMIKFKWSNVLHTVVCDTLCSIFRTPHSGLIDDLLGEGNLLTRIVITFSTDEKVGYRGHLRIVANAIRDCQAPHIKERLQENQEWSNFLIKLDELNEKHVSYKEAERRREQQPKKDQELGIGVQTTQPPLYPTSLLFLTPTATSAQVSSTSYATTATSFIGDLTAAMSEIKLDH